MPFFADTIAQLRRLFADRRKLFWFFVVFILSKAIVFFAPVLLSNVIDTESYGAIEYQLEFGQLIALLLTMGLSGVYPYYVLAKNQTNAIRVFYFHGMALACVSLVSTIIYFMSLLDGSVVTIILLGACFAQQYLLTFIYKTHSRNKSATFISSGIYVLLIFIILLLVSGILPLSRLFDFLWVISLSYSVVLGLFFLKKYIHAPPCPPGLYADATRRGVRLIIGGILVLLLTSCNRIYIEYFLGVSAVGVFGFYLRVATFLILFQQVIDIIYYRNLFQTDLVKMDRFLAAFLIVSFISSILVFLVFPAWFSGWFQILQNTYPQEKLLFFIVLIQMNFRVCISVLESFINRLDIVRQSNYAMIAVLLIMFTGILTLSHFTAVKMNMLLGVNVLAVFLTTEIEFLIIKKKTSIGFTKTRAVNYFILVIGVIGYLTL